MRLFELLETIEILDEVNMSPGALADFAKSKFAQSMTAGFEAELIVPGADRGDDEEQAPDYDMDQRVTSTQDIRDFFQGDYNGSRQVDRAIGEIDESFFEYADERIREEFDNDERDDMIRQILKDDDKTPEEIEEIMNRASGKEYDQAESTAWEEYRDNADYDQYTTKFFRTHYPYMSDIENSFQLDWPHYTSVSTGEGDSAEEVAKEIEDAIGMRVKASGGYHGAKRGPGFFILEPDSSINTDEGAGLELVSPPMPLNQAFEYLDKVFAWAKTRGCITDDSTGFHMGISIPDQTRENVDHLKFTLFLGDEYVLKQFGRESNSYTKSMMQEIAKRVKNLSAETGFDGSDKMTPESILKTFKAGLDSTAAKFVKTSLTTTRDRYVTVNIKDNYIEVRSAGGDYLDYGVEKIKNTLMRYVRAMGAAADPEAEKQEYAKKLYKFLSPMVRGEEDIIKYFAQYSAGTLPATALKSFVRKVQRDRQGKKADTGEDAIGEGPNLYLYNYYPVDGSVGMSSVNVRGTSRRDATAAFREKFSETGYNIHSIKDIEIKDDTGANGYQIVSMNGNTIARIFADSEQEAILMARARTRRAAMNDDEWKLRGPNGRYVDMAGSDGGNASYGIYKITDNSGAYLATITADNPMDAYTQASRRVQTAGLADGSWKLIAPGGRQIYPEPSSRIVSVGPAAERRPPTPSDIPELPGEFVADPMASGAQDYVVKFIDPDGAVQRTTVRANTAVQAREWFEENHPRTYHITDVWQQ
jgi:hypothetical protein